MQYIHICQNSQKLNMVLLKLSHLYPLNKDGYGFIVTEIKDFIFSLADMMSTMLVGDDDDVKHGDDVDPEESTDIEWAVINPQTPVSCLYQILH